MENVTVVFLAAVAGVTLMFFLRRTVGHARAARAEAFAVLFVLAIIPVGFVWRGEFDAALATGVVIGPLALAWFLFVSRTGIAAAADLQDGLLMLTFARSQCALSPDAVRRVGVIFSSPWMFVPGTIMGSELILVVSRNKRWLRPYRWVVQVDSAAGFLMRLQAVGFEVELDRNLW